MSFGKNQQICELFERLRDIRLEQGHQWKAKAYEKVIPILRGYHKDIESSIEAKSIPGIGTSMAAKIDEILKTGTLSELSSASLTKINEKDEILKLFQSIERVGPKTALKWYNAGYRKLTDIPPDVCNTGQWLGIQLHSQLTQRIPRAEIQQCEQLLHSLLDPQSIQFQICGSYRRGKSDSGDIDILIIAQSDKDVLAEVLKAPIFTHTLARGPKKFLGVCKINEIHRRIDIELVQPEEYPYAVLYFTGPARFNVLMREQAIKLGVRLNEKSLSNNQGQLYFAETEEDVFKLLGVSYLTPEQREQFA